MYDTPQAGAAKVLQNALHHTRRSMQIASIFEGLYKPLPETVNLREWLPTDAPPDMAFEYVDRRSKPITKLPGHALWIQIQEPVVADLFLALSYDNVYAHGQAPKRATCEIRDRYNLYRPIRWCHWLAFCICHPIIVCHWLAVSLSHKHVPANYA